jgi:hypothetical protein
VRLPQRHTRPVAGRGAGARLGVAFAHP